MSKAVKVKYEKGVLKTLEPLNLEEGEEIRIVIQPSESIAEKLYGIARKHQPSLGREKSS